MGRNPAPATPPTPDLDRAIGLLWGATDGRPNRGPRPKLTVAQIAKAALAIADAEGLAAVSMQRVAAKFGFTTMALYRYLPGKAELVAAMVEVALDAPPDLSIVPGGWRGRLLAWCEAMGAILRRHPCSLEVLSGLRVMGPNEMAWLEAAVRALEGTRLTGSEKLDAIFTLMAHVRATTQYAVPPPPGALSSGQWGEALIRAARRRPDEHPALLAAIAGGALAEGHGDGAAFGLCVILDGLTARSD